VPGGGWKPYEDIRPEAIIVHNRKTATEKKSLPHAPDKKRSHHGERQNMTERERRRDVDKSALLFDFIRVICMQGSDV
jgi:hypothetical protein